MMIPRIRGSAIKVGKKWSWEMFVGMMGSDEADLYTTKELYKTRKEAVSALRVACRTVCEAIETKVDGKPSGKFIDMKTNATRNWDEN